jgi:frataxin-like iron-binding protein CyaY
MMLHINGSHHQWFQDERWHDLILILDDAASEPFSQSSIFRSQHWEVASCISGAHFEIDDTTTRPERAGKTSIWWRSWP